MLEAKSGCHGDRGSGIIYNDDKERRQYSRRVLASIYT